MHVCQRLALPLSSSWEALLAKDLLATNLKTSSLLMLSRGLRSSGQSHCHLESNSPLRWAWHWDWCCPELSTKRLPEEWTNNASMTQHVRSSTQQHQQHEAWSSLRPTCTFGRRKWKMAWKCLELPWSPWSFLLYSWKAWEARSYIRFSLGIPFGLRLEQDKTLKYCLHICFTSHCWNAIASQRLPWGLQDRLPFHSWRNLRQCTQC